jgi:hypothetical protein
MEHAFDYDFSGVRVHQGGLADTLRVPACACGSDLYFAPDRYRPDDPVGQALLAHELAHVVQQQTGRVANPFGTGVAVLLDPVLEAAADRCAAWAIHGERVPSFETQSAHAAGAVGPAFLLPHADPRWDGPPRVVQCVDYLQDGHGNLQVLRADGDNDLSPPEPSPPEHSWSVIYNARARFNPLSYGVNRIGPRNRHRITKTIAAVSMPAATAADTAAQLGTGTSALHVAGMVAAGASAAAIGATGIGLIAAGAVLTVAASAVNLRSAYKTNKHINNLQDIQAQSRGCSCKMLSTAANVQHLHDPIRDTILPYIISQKKRKLFKKTVGAVPGVGMGMVAARGGQAFCKWRNHTKGVCRSLYADFLAVHLLTAECQLVDAIISELLSPEELRWMKGELGMDNNFIAPIIADKMKSV